MRAVKRPAFTILELTVAMAVLAVIGVVAMKFSIAVGRRSADARQHQAAIVEAGNVMERLAVRPWEQLTPDALRDVSLSDEARQAVPGAVLKVEVQQQPQEPGAKRLAVEIRWPDDSGQPVLKARLVAWRYRMPDAKGGGHDAAK
jgi:prepilin-type N-terminal cleavage/methylation domain-containing protein